MKHPIKLFFLDLDGTLLDEIVNGEKVISKINLKALKDGTKKGYKSCISTGRIGEKALHYLKMSNLKYAVTGNGSQIIDNTGRVIRELRIKDEKMHLIAKFIEKNNLSIKIDNDRIAYNVITPEAVLMAKKLKYEISNGDTYKTIKDRIKLIIWGKSPDELPKIIPDFEKAVPGISIVSAERGWTLEVTTSEATKAQGNLWAMKNLFKIDDPNLVCHIGDTMNDFPVIGTIKYFVSPLDAQKDLLKKAPFITVAHFDHAVSEVMNGNFWKNPFRN